MKDCGKELKNTKVLTEHQRTVHGNKPFGCQQCGKTFPKASNLKRHVPVHDKDNKDNVKMKRPRKVMKNKSMVCPEWPKCEIVFSNEMSLKNHIEREHNDSTYPCSQCTNVFKSKKDLMDHMIDQHADKLDRTCKHCHKIYFSHRDMKTCMEKHERDVMNIKQEDFDISMKSKKDKSERTCKHCHKVFKFTKNMKLCMRKHEGTNIGMKHEEVGIKNMKQEIDSMSMTSKEDSVDHPTQKHIDELERTCSYCYKIFNCINSMKECMNKHEEDDLIISRNYEYNKNISIICEDGVKVKTNIFLLSSVSPWLYTIILEQIHQEEITIIFPDIQSEKVIKLVREIEIVIIESTLETLMKQKPDAISPFCQVLCLRTKSDSDKLNNDGECNKTNFHKVSIKSEPIESTHETCDSKNTHFQDALKTKSEQIDDYSESNKDSTVYISGSKLEILEESSQKDTGVDTGKKRGMNKLSRPKRLALVAKQEIFPKVGNENPGQNVISLILREDYKQSLKLLRINQKKVSLALRKEHKDSFFIATLCPFCGTKFENRNLVEKANYENHVMKHASDQVPCECQETWKTNAEKAKHLKVKHLGYSQCNKCSQYFRKKKSLVSHIQQKHNENKKEFLCYVCAKSFKENTNLNMHIKHMHENEVVTCDYCQESFVGRNKMLNHRRTAHEIKGKQCPICGKTIRELSKHLRFVHAEEKDKNHLCDGCDKGFLTRTKLEDHRMNVHIKTRPYKCSYGCSFAYNDRANRNAHEKKKHGELFKKSVDENYL